MESAGQLPMRLIFDRVREKFPKSDEKDIIRLIGKCPG